MRARARVAYEVSSFGHTMWCCKRKRWLHMSDPLYGEDQHEGYSSHKGCRTKRAAERLCRSLDLVADKGARIFLLRFTWPRGVRRIDEFTFVRSASTCSGGAQ